jgi:transposase InsO family protein
MLLDDIIPWFGLIENIDSDNGSHFTANIIRGLARALGIRWEYHTPWHPPSLGKVERMSQTLKRQLTKLVLETRLPWIKCLHLASLRIRTALWKDTGLSPYEMLYVLPYLDWPSGLPSFETKDQVLWNYMLSLS